MKKRGNGKVGNRAKERKGREKGGKGVVVPHPKQKAGCTTDNIRYRTNCHQ